MTHQPQQPSIFEQMRAQIHTTAMTPAPTQRRWTPRPRTRRHAVQALSATVVVVVAATVSVLLLLTSSAGSPAAYGATLHPDHTVTITLRQFHAVKKLNARLKALGTRIRVVPIIPGCHAPVRTVANGKIAPGAAHTLHAHPGTNVSITVAVNTIPGRTFVIASTPSGMSGVNTVVVGPAPHCVA